MNNMRQLILMRHGRAGGGAPDELRSLTPLGRNDVTRIGHQIKKTGWAVDRIVHSGYKRAQETATLLSGILKPDAGIEIITGITPDANAFSIRQTFDDANRLLIVSHLPLLDGLVYEFISPVHQNDLIYFMPGTAVGLINKTRWALAWHFNP